MWSEVARLDEHIFIYSTDLPHNISNFLNKLMVRTMQLSNFQGTITLCSNLHATIIYIYISFTICYRNSSAELIKHVTIPTLNWQNFLGNTVTIQDRWEMFWIDVASCLKRLYYSIMLRVGDIILPHARTFQSLAPILPKTSKKPSPETFMWQIFWWII